MAYAASPRLKTRNGEQDRLFAFGQDDGCIERIGRRFSSVGERAGKVRLDESVQCSGIDARCLSERTRREAKVTNESLNNEVELPRNFKVGGHRETSGSFSVNV